MHYVKKEIFVPGGVADADTLMREFYRASGAEISLDQNNIKDNSINYSTTVDPGDENLHYARATTRTTTHPSTGVGPSPPGNTQFILFRENIQVPQVQVAERWIHGRNGAGPGGSLSDPRRYLEFETVVTTPFMIYVSGNIDIIPAGQQTPITCEIFINGEPSGVPVTVAGSYDPITPLAGFRTHVCLFHQTVLPPGNQVIEFAAKKTSSLLGYFWVTDINIAAIGFAR